MNNIAKMDGFEEFVYNALVDRAKHWSDDVKVNALINHYEDNYTFYANLVENGTVSSASVIVDNDYYNISAIELDKNIVVQNIKREDIEHTIDEFTDKQYFYSFDINLTKDREFMELVNVAKNKELKKDIEMEF